MKLGNRIIWDDKTTFFDKTHLKFFVVWLHVIVKVSKAQICFFICSHKSCLLFEELTKVFTSNKVYAVKNEENVDRVVKFFFF